MKTYKLFRIAFTTILFMMAGVSQAQLSGNYTVGGSNPDFAILPDVTSALQTQGVSGPVTFNLRAGTAYFAADFRRLRKRHYPKQRGL